MEEPPEADGRGQQHQPEDLVAPVGTLLFGAPLGFLGLLEMWLDAGLDHGGLSVPQYRGMAIAGLAAGGTVQNTVQNSIYDKFLLDLCRGAAMATEAGVCS